MKKQLLIMAIALFAIGISSAYGQALAPRAITCLSADALHPIAGTPYTYTITVPTPPTGVKNVLWFATQDKNFITNKVLTSNRIPTGSIMLATAGPAYNVSTAGQLTMILTWNSFIYDALNPVFVVVNVVNVDGSCSPNNMKVYKIMPINAFTLDIANLDKTKVLQTGYGTNIDRCISDIISATYLDAAPNDVTYDFGADTLYYEVSAANWSVSWLPSATVTLPSGSENTVTLVQWSTAKTFLPAISHVMTLAATIYTSTDVVVPSTGTFVGALGESIFIRVVIDHSNGTLNNEGLVLEQVAVAVDGKTFLAAVLPQLPIGDVHYDNGPNSPPCPALVVDGFTNDIALQTILPRPDIQDATPPATDDFLLVKP